MQQRPNQARSGKMSDPRFRKAQTSQPSDRGNLNTRCGAARRKFSGSAEAVEELLGAGEVGLALELCPHVACPFEEERGLGGVAGGGGGGADEFERERVVGVDEAGGVELGEAL